MTVDFDTPIDRTGTACLKVDGAAARFGQSDLLPLWVADMDFPAPAAVTQALIERARHPVYGYTLYPDSLYEALLDWLETRHHWAVPREWLLLAPGVVPSLHAAALALTEPGEGIVIQPPVYGPFRGAVTETGRRLMENPLRFDGQRYRIDYEHLEHCARQGARLLFLCSPHNPVGRVWQADELTELMRIVERYDMRVLSDEIHHDLIYPGHRHIPLGAQAEDPTRVITALAPSKSFNVPGLGLSALIVPEARQRDALQRVFRQMALGQANPFSVVAFEAAYRNGADWLDALRNYLAGNRDRVRAMLAGQGGALRLIEPEGTYLLWLDARALAMDDAALAGFFTHKARVGLNAGIEYGQGGQGFMRLNIATPRARLEQALGRILTALHTL